MIEQHVEDKHCKTISKQQFDVPLTTAAQIVHKYNVNRAVDDVPGCGHMSKTEDMPKLRTS